MKLPRNPNAAENHDAAYDRDTNGRFVAIQQNKYQGKVYRTPVYGLRFATWSEAARWCRHQNGLGAVGGDAMTFFPAELG